MTESNNIVRAAFIMDIVGFWTRDPSNVARELYHYATEHFVMCVRFLILVIYYWHGSRLIIMELKVQRGSGASRANSESELFYFIVAHGAHWHPIPHLSLICWPCLCIFYLQNCNFKRVSCLVYIYGVKRSEGKRIRLWNFDLV